MAVKKTQPKVVEVVTPVVIPLTVGKNFIKGPHHIVKDGEVILDPNYVNPGVFSSN